MIEVTCHSCGKSYRIDESRISGTSAKFQCQGCGQSVRVEKKSTAAPALQADAKPAAGFAEPTTALPPSASTTAPEATDAPGRQAESGAERSALRFGLTTRTIVLMLLVSLLPLLLFGFFTRRTTVNLIQSDTEDLMAQTAAGLSAEVDQWVDKNLRALRNAARLAAIQNMLPAQQEPVLKAMHEEYPWMYLVFTLLPNGMNLARNDGNPVTDYADRQYYKDVMAGKAMAWQTLIGRTSKKPALVLAVPIKSGEKIVGVMAAAMSIDDISKTVARWQKGASGFAFLVDENAKVVAHQIEEYVISEKQLGTHPLVAAYRQEQKPLTLNFKNETGRAVLGHARGNAMGWVLAIQQERDEVFKALHRMEWVTVALLAVTVALVFLIAWFAARSLVRPIQALTHAAERISMGNLDIQIPVSSQDEIGMLAKAIGRMQTSLQIAVSRMQRKR